MFLQPMTLQSVSQLRDPRERVPLAEQRTYEEALHLIQNGSFERARLAASPAKMDLDILFNAADGGRALQVKIREEADRSLSFFCPLCGGSSTCSHRWASYVLLWQCLTLPPPDIRHPSLAALAETLQGPQYLGASDSESRETAAAEPEAPAATAVELHSLSLFFTEPELFSSNPVKSEIFESPFAAYTLTEVDKDRQLISPRLWSLPEVFNRKLSAFSEHYFNEVNRLNRTADVIRYNFSNGHQISAREILRHPLHRKVPGDLLPQTEKNAPAVFSRWPLVQQDGNAFITQALSEVEGVMQLLLARVAAAQSRGQIPLYLQHSKAPQRAIQVQTIEFSPEQNLRWRVDFTERPELQAEIRLVSSQTQEMVFYPSFALLPADGKLIVHPWAREFSRLRAELDKIPQENRREFAGKPVFEITGEPAIRKLLRYLHSRPIPLDISGGSVQVPHTQSATEIHLQEQGEFFLRHDARVPNAKNLQRRGWSQTSQKYLFALSEGLPAFLGSEARDLATGQRVKRDWDLKLLRHLGILQYVCLETLAWHFEGELTDGRIVDESAIFAALHDRIQPLLITGAEASLVREVPLSELCSRPVLAAFEEFIRELLRQMKNGESFYSESGEIVLQGIQEREFRLLYELLKKLALVTGGEAFRRTRTALLDKISATDFSKAEAHDEALFYFPTGESERRGVLHHSLEVVQFLIPHGFRIYYKGQPLQELAEDEFRIDFSIRGDRDQKQFNWFELNPKFFLLGEEVNPDHLLSLGGGGVIEYQGKLYLVPKKQMPSLRRLENFWQKLQKGRGENRKNRLHENIYQLPRHQTLELLALRFSGIHIHGDDEWQRLCAFYDNLGQSEPDVRIPRSVKAELKPYQRRGVKWLQDLYNLRLGALLADDMGLGKTLQTLSFLEALRIENELGHSLIVVPSSLIFNWQHEVDKFTPQIPLQVFSGKEKEKIGRKLAGDKPLTLLTTYGLLMEHGEFFTAHKWKILVFDEAQNIKNISTKRTGAARSLQAQFKICLTGTPMENHYGEFYSLVDLLVPGSLGPIEDFRRQYVNRDTVLKEQVEDLRLKIKPLLLRRTKKEILDQLPEKQETKVSIAFEDRQKEIYRDIALSYNQRVQEALETTVREGKAQGAANVQLQMLTALLRLRQACSDPAALPDITYEKVPPKLEALLESLQEVVESGESALVFTQFLQTLERTEKLLREANIPVYILHGGVPTRQRQKILSEFNARSDGAVLVMTLKTGGVGLNLTKASYVFHLEPWWNPAVENQATDRAHRLGQNRAVQVFKYIMHESLEEKIEQLKERKDKKFQSLLGNSETGVDIGSGGSALTKEDFDLLLGLK